MQRYIWLLAVSLISAGRGGAFMAQTLHREPPVQIFTTLGLTPTEVSAIDAGRPVAEGALVGDAVGSVRVWRGAR